MVFQCLQFIQLIIYQGDLDCEEIYENYILKYKYDNLVHILLLALNAAIFVSASVTLALMTNQLVSKRIQSFLALLGLEVGLYIIYLVLNYIIAVHQTKLIQKNDFVYSSVLS